MRDNLEASEPEFELPEGMTEEEVVQTLLSAYHKTKNPKYLDPNAYFADKYEFYPSDPVSPERWLMDEDHMGEIGQRTWPMIQDEFMRIMTADPRPARLIFKGSISWGKTFLSALIMARLLYELGCLRYPQLHYGLAPSTTISFMNLSVTGGHAKRIMFSELMAMIDGSPWFNTKFIRKKPLFNMLWWPKKQITFLPGNSSELAALGAHLYGGVIEEANFFPVVQYSKRIKNPMEREWDQAKHLHDSLFRRIKGRYQRLGRIPGMLILNSSANYPEDFLEKLAGQLHNDPYTWVVEHSQWETQPQTRFSGRRFFVFVGDKYQRPKVVESETEKEQLAAKGEVVSVPEEFAEDFAIDLDGSIRDVMGKNVRATNKFFDNVDRILEMVDARIPVPFSDKYREGVVFDELFDSLKWDKLINPICHMKKDVRPFPLLHPQAMRFAHIDLSTTGDATGVCVCHVGEMDEVRRFIEGRGEMVKEILPVIWVDLILRILPGKDPQGIMIEQIREILYDLNQKVGFRFARITYDSWQSTGSIQVLQRRFGEDVVGVIRPGKKKGGENYWWVCRDAMYESRIRCYDYPSLFRELSALERDPVTGVIDHPVGGNDDTAVSLAGGVYNAMENFDVGIVDAPQMGEAVRRETLDERLERETKQWLVGEAVSGHM